MWKTEYERRSDSTITWKAVQFSDLMWGYI
jgi:hypothetical protein